MHYTVLCIQLTQGNSLFYGCFIAESNFFGFVTKSCTFFIHMSFVYDSNMLDRPIASINMVFYSHYSLSICSDRGKLYCCNWVFCWNIANCRSPDGDCFTVSVSLQTPSSDSIIARITRSLEKPNHHLCIWSVFDIFAFIYCLPFLCRWLWSVLIYVTRAGHGKQLGNGQSASVWNSSNKVRDLWQQRRLTSLRGQVACLNMSKVFLTECVCSQSPFQRACRKFSPCNQIFVSPCFFFFLWNDIYWKPYQLFWRTRPFLVEVHSPATDCCDVNQRCQ